MPPTEGRIQVPPNCDLTLGMVCVDKDEPAYLYHRLQGGEQIPLRGARQTFRDYTVSITGETSTIEVPIGSDLVVHAATDRKLQRPVRIEAPPSVETGAIVPDQIVHLADDAHQVVR